VVAVRNVYGSGLRSCTEVAETIDSYTAVACSVSLAHAPNFLRAGPCLGGQAGVRHVRRSRQTFVCFNLSQYPPRMVRSFTTMGELSEGWLWRPRGRSETSRAVSNTPRPSVPHVGLQSGLCGHGGHSGSGLVRPSSPAGVICSLAAWPSLLPPRLNRTDDSNRQFH
jgi:hypothetical protein